MGTFDATGTQASTYDSYSIAGDGGTSATADAAATVYRGTASAHESAQLAIAEIDTALTTVATERATLGAKQAELESTVRNLANVAENTAAAAAGLWIPITQQRQPTSRRHRSYSRLLRRYWLRQMLSRRLSLVCFSNLSNSLEVY